MAEEVSSPVSTVEITVENIEKALHQLYFDSNLANKDTAQKWLTLAQRAPQAWQYCWILLEPSKPPEVQFFGACTIHIKISKSWNELHPEQYEILRTQLFQNIFQFSSGTMSSFVLNTMPEIWPKAIQGIIDTFQQTNLAHLNDTDKCTALLELLTVLPEEFHTSPMLQSRRGHVRHELQQGIQCVLPLLERLLTTESPMAIQQHALKCFSSWVMFGIPLTDIEMMIQMLFRLIHNPDLFDICVDAIVNVVCNPIAYNYPNGILKMIPQALLLREKFNSAVDEKDAEVCNGICRLVVCIGENHSKCMLECPEEYKEPVMELTRFILSFSALPGYFPVDETISNIPFGFWYIMQDDIISAASDHFQQYTTVYTPVYMQLAEVLLNKVQYPPDSEYDGWSADEKEEFRCYRQDIADTLMYAYTLLREPFMLEACLFVFRSIAEGLEYGDDQCVQNLMMLLPQIPLTNNKLASTAMYMLGAYAEWLHDFPDALQTVIPLLLSGLHNAELAIASTVALKDISAECIPHLQPFATDILSTTEAVFTTNVVKSRELIRLMSTVGYTLSSLRLSSTMSYLDVLVGPIVQQLEALTSEQPSAITKSGIHVRINMLSMLFSTLDYRRPDNTEEGTTKKQPAPPQSEETQPVLLVLQQVFPLIQKIVSVWLTDTGIIEDVCELLKRAQRTLLDDMAPLVPQLSQIIVQIYSVIPQSSVLELAKSLMMLFSTDEAQLPTLKSLYVSLSTKTLSIFQTAGIHEHTDVIESYMSLISQLLRKCPHVVVCEDCNPLPIYQIGLVGLTLPETITVKSTAIFFCDFINQSSKFPLLAQIVTDYGQNLVEIILKAIGGASPRQVMDHMADILMSLNKNTFQLLCKWLEELLSIPQFPSPIASKEDKEHFKKSVVWAFLRPPGTQLCNHMRLA
uniref:Importin-13 n=1 Tax=Saccoglossus kowalevskii TaxID=10224 RepID=A0ABM0MY08_SACKO|nr:PREDICTED: importin-13-like [Saccoglossus kowalevskii]